MFEMQHELPDHGATSPAAGIIKQVIRALGPPADLIKVAVHPVGTGRYRVNVLVGATAAMARVANSFFLTTDDEGNVISCTPKLVRQYVHRAHEVPQGQANLDEVY